MSERLKLGDEVWVRAIVTDPCTSCVGVRIPTIHAKDLHTYVRPANAGRAALRAKEGQADG